MLTLAKVRFALIAAIAIGALLCLPGRISAQSTRPGQFDSVELRRIANGSGTGSAPTAPPGKTIEFVQVAAALCIVIGLILVLRWGARRWLNLPVATQTANRSVKVIGRTIIAPRQHVLLLQVGRRVIVASDSNGSIHALAQITDAEEVAELVGQATFPPAVTKFGSLFGREQSNFDETASAQEMNSAAETSMSATKMELGGLMEKVRAISKQIKQ